MLDFAMKRTCFCNFTSENIDYNVTRQILFAQHNYFLNRTQFNSYVRNYDGNCKGNMCYRNAQHINLYRF